MIKTILFDMDETLCPTYEASEKAAQEIFSNLPRIGDRSEVYLNGIYNRPKNTAAMTELEYRVDVIVKASNYVLTTEEAEKLQIAFDDRRLELLTFFDGVEEMLIAARDKGFTLGVITNGSPFSQHPKVKALNLKEYVDFVIVGGDEPEQKPANSIFNKALSLAKCTANEAIMVGDSAFADIGGAHRLGMASILVKAECKEHRKTKSSIENPKASYTTHSASFTLELVEIENKLKIEDKVIL